MGKGDIVSYIVIAIFVLGSMVVASYAIAHEKGYEQGIWHAQLYYEATGNFPTEDWVARHEGDKLYYEEEILRTLEPFKEIK